MIAVDDLSLSISKGEMVTFLGPSGCGKTTTLRMLAGFLTPTRGDIYVKGERINDKPPYLRSTGLVFQNYAIFPHMTVYENIGYGLKMRGRDQHTIKEEVEKGMELVRLGGLGDRYPKQLSGGQQQRVALARALVIQPDLLLLDEPLSNLDLKLRQQMRSEIKAIQRRVGITTVYVTHDQGEALALSDRVAVIDKGRLVQIGSPKDVYEKPRTRFVAEFIGEANYFRGVIVTHDQKSIEVNVDGQIILASPDQGIELTDVQDVGVCIRPESLQISKTGVGKDNVFRGTIDDVVYVGSNLRYRVMLDKKVVVVDKQVASLDDIYQPGEEVVIEWSKISTILLRI